MKKAISLALAAWLALGFASVAGAHVTVQPKEAPQGSYQVFTVRVPTEKEVATTAVKLAVPDGVDVSRFEPKPDWTYETETDADGRITAVTWKSAGAGLGATEFGEFRLQGKVADDAVELSWKAYQTYEDGTVVEWTGAPDAEHPASVTTVTPAVAGSGDGHGVGTAAAEAYAGDGEGRDALTLTLAIAGLAAGLLALAVALARKPAKARG